MATSLLAATLAGAGVAATLITPPGRILALAPAAPPAVLFSCFVLAFLCAESGLVHAEIRRQTYSFSLSGIALLLGVLSGDVRALVLARVIGAVLVFGWQRLPALKVAYNVSAYTLETALTGLGLHLLLGGGVELNLGTAVVCYLVVGLVDLLMSGLVLLVISWHQHRVTLREAGGVLVPAAVLGLLSTVAAFAVIVILTAGTLGAALILVLATLGATLYRGYLMVRRRHQSLAVVHDFVEQGVGAATVEELAEVLLGRTRRLLNAESVELSIFREDSDSHRPDRVLRSSADDSATGAPVAAGSSDWLFTRVRENAEAIVIPRTTRERGMRQWLISRAARDAMIVPLSSGSFAGVLIVTDRLGETATFTTDDLSLLQTLAGHIAVALRGIQLVQQLRHDATHDVLTGLANRVLLTEGIEATLSSTGAQPRARPIVLLLDLDKFKEVNDALGHHVGDALLQVVGERIRTQAPDGAIVARLGGDEFAVLITVLAPESADAASARADVEAQARRIAHDVFTAIGTPISLAEAVLSTRASIGLAIGAPGLTGADLLRHADTAMYAAKAGRQPVVVYSDDLDQGRAERLTLLADLHLALPGDQLVMRYQPQLDLHTDRIVSVEALVRWQHPTRGLLGPDDFIPLAESSGLIGELTHQVLRKALRQCRQWRDAGLDLVVAVNLSADNVNNAHLAEDVAAALADAGLPADRLILEITESSVMGDPERTVPILQRLADIGVTLSLDDFGTGYSSLAYLQKLPVSEVKIDKSFVMGMTGGAEAHASSVLVRSILTLGANLGLRVVAEGIEDAEVLELLRSLGCDVGQGYFIARPLSATQISALVDPLRSGRRHLSAVASSVA